jgi:hypothetical protein
MLFLSFGKLSLRLSPTQDIKSQEGIMNFERFT